ncbi:hypothetical protein [Verrucosispora sp. FIM060022]|uniref:hypothetical protein n=1 Tax=Verrucosispora sp. FIM060022 TaxID=1479020 RepID=UPI000F8966AB|nr:hypothetical protein [Verrucosispora sp. FIM060022]RUL94459.1 hypothetical protein EG812_01810 [Verrucosispora sp. FIM060022]
MAGRLPSRGPGRPPRSPRTRRQTGGRYGTTAALLPAAEQRSLPGEWHGVPAATGAPVVAGFLRRDPAQH